MMPKSTALCAALALAGTVHAAQNTQTAPGDPRIRFVNYDPNNIVTVYGRIGTDTLILFEKGETVIDMTGGDTEAWGANTPRARNGIFVKPKATVANTNIHVITNKRIYNFDMKLAPRGQVSYLMLTFRYPAAETAASTEAAGKEKVRGLLAAAHVAKNRKYTVQGAGSITPIEASDDGTVTTFRFAAHGTVPAFYTKGEDGKEHLVNFNAEANDTLTTHAVSAKFILRAGDLVACVFNEAYSPTGVRPATNTASPQVERLVKKGETP
jgi:type IV secretion system protein VirB9